MTTEINNCNSCVKILFFVLLCESRVCFVFGMRLQALLHHALAYFQPLLLRGHGWSLWSGLCSKHAQGFPLLSDVIAVVSHTLDFPCIIPCAPQHDYMVRVMNALERFAEMELLCTGALDLTHAMTKCWCALWRLTP